MADRIWSPQQQAVFQFVSRGRGNAIVEAVAGSGKTTTLVEAMRLMQGSVAFAAYNKKIATEIESRVGKVQGVRVGTFHSFGFGAWRRVAPNVKVEDKKVGFLIQNMPQVPEEWHRFVGELVSIAKQRAFGVLTVLQDTTPWYEAVTHFDLTQHLTEGDPESQVPDAVRYAMQVLVESSKLDKEVVDFDDMIYAPLLHRARVWENDWVLVDECQDLNPARRSLARRMLKQTGRLLAVGDRAQAIYGFTGADNDGMLVTQQSFNCAPLPLTVTYRCPQAVVREAQRYVSHIQAHESAPEGHVASMDTATFWRQLKAIDLQNDDAILCRNTKPLVELAYALLRKGVACHVEGRDIGQGLLRLATRWRSIKTLVKLRDRLQEYKENQTARLMAKGQETQAEALADKVETLYAIMDSLPSSETKVEALRDAINRLFTDEDPPRTLTLSTVHKSKGREWDRVFLYHADLYMPSSYARQQWQVDQELNLLYVAVTRSKGKLVYVNAK